VTSVTELLNRGYTPEQLLDAVLGNLGYEITDKIETQFYCNCSKERVEQAVVSIGRKDLQEMIDDGEDIEVKCHFCNSAYKYTVEELEDIIKRSK
jgi:molecular chaperone Hsp33